MGKKYRYIIFDVDGTLLDTTEGISAAVMYTIKKYNLPEVAGDKLRSFIGPPIFDSFQKNYGLDTQQANKLTECFRERYKTVDLLRAYPYEGIHQVCQKLIESNVKIGVATYKRQDYAEKILHFFGFDSYSNYLFGADYNNKFKKKDIILHCIEAMRIKDYSEILMVGDSISDAEGARSIGIDFLGVTYGFGFETASDVMNIGAVGYADEPRQILNFI